MNEIPLATGETARYEYDTRADSLYVELAEGGGSGDFEPLAEMPQVRVRRGGDGAVASLTVKGVQALILQHLVRDLVALARADEQPVAPGEESTPSRDAAPHAGDAGVATGTAVADTAAAAVSSVPEDSGHDLSAGPKKKHKGKQKGKGRRPPKASDESAAASDEVRHREQRAPELRKQEQRKQEQRAAEDRDADEHARDDAGTGGDDATETSSSLAGSALGAEQDTASADVPVGVPAKAASGDTPVGFQSFAVDPAIGSALASMGFSDPTPIQERAIPVALTGTDMVGLAQTGTGKTVAFLVPTLHHLLERPDGKHRPRLLVVTPTRELAVQIGQQVETLAQFTSLRLAVVYGGAGMRPQVTALRKGADVIVATPGRLLDHVRRGNARLDAVQMLVLDEADRMLDMGFMPDVRRILERVPDERQTLLFGATLPPDIESLSRRFQRDPQVVEIARQLPPATLDQVLYPVGRHLKIPLLIHLLKTDPDLSRVLVFTETKVETDIVARKVGEAGLEVASMHGDRPQRDRERALKQLKDGQVQALIATNVAARGIDIEDVTHVVNYDMPQSVDDYVHRIGRTARGATAAGTAYTFVTIGDESMVMRIQSALDCELPRVKSDGFDYDVPTPSWAQPSAQDVARSLHPPSASNLSRSFRPRRR